MLPVVTGTSVSGWWDLGEKFLFDTNNQPSLIDPIVHIPSPFFSSSLVSCLSFWCLVLDSYFLFFFLKGKNEIFYSGCCCCQLAARGKITAALALASHLKSSQPSLEWGRCRREKVGRSRRVEKKDRVLGNRLSYDSATLRPTHSRKSRAWGVCGWDYIFDCTCQS